MTEHSFLFNTQLIGERSNQSHSKDGITGKLLNKVIWRYFLCLRILNPEISLHFAMALREAYDTLNNLLTDQINSIMLSKTLVNTYGNNFHLCAKANITDLLIHFCSHVCELCILRDCIQIASKAMPKLRRWNETLKFNFFSPFWGWGSHEKPWFVDLSSALEQRFLMSTMLPISALLKWDSLTSFYLEIRENDAMLLKNVFWICLSLDFFRWKCYKNSNWSYMIHSVRKCNI